MIKGKNIYLRYLTIEDAEFLHNAMNLTETKRYYGKGMAIPLKEMKKWIINKEKSRKLNKSFDFVIIDKDTKEKIGTINIFGIDNFNKIGNIGLIWIQKKYRDLGIAKEALNLVIKFGFKDLKLNKLKLFTINPIMKEVAKRCNMKKEAILRKELLIGNKWFDVTGFIIFKKN